MSIKKKDVLEIFESNPQRAIKFDELITFFNINRHPRKKLIPIVQTLLRDGFIEKRGKGLFILAKPQEEITGRLIRNTKGFGFLVPDEGGAELYISPNDITWNGLMNGDVITVAKTFDHTKGMHYGKFLEIVQRRNHIAYGKMISKRGSLAVELRGTGEIVFIQHGRLNGARKDDWVEIDIKKWPTSRTDAYGEVLTLLSKKGSDASNDDYIVINELNIRDDFDEAVELEAHKLKEPNQDEASYKDRFFVDERGLKRTNLLALDFVTIDGWDARDFDDAVYLVRNSNLLKLFVSIADVSHYVVPGSKIDTEARLRTTSVYFPSRAIHMLPTPLSTNICSLRPDKIRYTMTAELHFNEKFEEVHANIYPSVIKSRHRLNYAQVEKILHPEFNDAPDYELNASQIPDHIKGMLMLMGGFSQDLHRIALKRGCVELNIPEAHVYIDEKGNVTDIKKRPDWTSHKLIEEFMIAANVAAARQMKRKNSGVFRIHEQPSNEKLQEYSKTACYYQAQFDPNWNTSRDLANYIKKIKSHPARSLLNRMLLRSLKKAKYSANMEVGHFALALRDYTHFTSPIRRYPDLVVHRLLKKEPGPAEVVELEAISAMCTEGEIRAMEAERTIIRIKQSRYLEAHIKNKFHGEISGMTENGMFVELKEVFIEGFISYGSMMDDFYVFDERKMAVTGRKTKKIYKLGDEVVVNVREVNVLEGRNDFSLET